MPGSSAADIPVWLNPSATTHYTVPDYTVAGAEKLLRLLLGQPLEAVPPLGEQPSLPPREASPAAPGLRTPVTVRAELRDGWRVAETEAAGTLLGRREAAVPTEALTVWEGLQAGPLVAAERMATAGRALARALFEEPVERVLAGLMDRVPPGDWVDVVLEATGRRQACRWSCCG